MRVSVGSSDPPQFPCACVPSPLLPLSSPLAFPSPSSYVPVPGGCLPQQGPQRFGQNESSVAVGEWPLPTALLPPSCAAGGRLRRWHQKALGGPSHAAPMCCPHVLPRACRDAMVLGQRGVGCRTHRPRLVERGTHGPTFPRVTSPVTLVL